MKKSDLYREWARVLDMCEGTNVDPGLCWVRGGIGRNVSGTPEFTENPEQYSFAVAILEDKPVFVGDKVFIKGGHWVTVESDTHISEEIMSWQPPKKTFTLNGEELPCPGHSFGGRYPVTIGAVSFWFSTEEDMKKVNYAIIKLLKDATK